MESTFTSRWTAVLVAALLSPLPVRSLTPTAIGCDFVQITSCYISVYLTLTPTVKDISLPLFCVMSTRTSFCIPTHFMWLLGKGVLYWNSSPMIHHRWSAYVLKTTFFRPSWFWGPCAYSGKSWLCPGCTLWTWLSNDNYFIFLDSPSPLGVNATHQYKWFMILCSHFPMSSQSFCFAAASNFLWKPESGINSSWEYYLSAYWYQAFSNMPDIVVMFYFWMCLSDPLVDLFVSISNRNTYLQTFPFQKIHCSTKTLLLHMVTSAYLIAPKERHTM